MISPPKLVLEAVVLVAGMALFRFSHDRRKQRFALIFAACTVALNLLFDYAAAWPLYRAYGQAAGIGRAGLHALVGFDVFKWGVLAYFLSQMAAGWGDSSAAGGFAALRPNIRLRDVISTGVLAGIAAAGLAYTLSLLALRLGFIQALPWSFFKQNPLYLGLGFWGGLRNLFGEEILARLGAQTILLRLLRKIRGGPILAVILSALYFEFWHNGFKEIYFMNFAVSCAFAWAYHKRGYESAALAHCTADWLMLVILPRVLF